MNRFDLKHLHTYLRLKAPNLSPQKVPNRLYSVIKRFRDTNNFVYQLTFSPAGKLTFEIETFHCYFQFIFNSNHTSCHVISFIQKDLINLLSEKEIYDLERIFRALDTDNDGMISVADARLVYSHRMKDILVIPEDMLPR